MGGQTVYRIVPYGRGLPRILLEEKAPPPGAPWTIQYDLILERADGLGLGMFFELELETPDAVLESGNVKRYKDGFRFRAELAWKEFYGERIAGFLAKLHNWLGETGKNRRIRVCPHIDVGLWHEVFEEKGWDYGYLGGRWVGFDGVVVLRGIEIYDEMPYLAMHETQPLGAGRWGVKIWGPADAALQAYQLSWE